MQTRLRGCWNGVRRGVKYGAIAGITIWAIILIVMLSATLVIPGLWERGFADFEKDWNHYGPLWMPLKIVGTFIAGFALIAMYGIVAGGFVMGVAGFFRPGGIVQVSAASGEPHVVE